MSAVEPRGGANAVPARPPSRVAVTWTGGHRFEAVREGGASLRMDGAGETAPSPTDTLLSALAGCTSIDAVDILGKRRTPPAAFRVEVEGTRVESTPRRFSHVLLTYHIDGAGIERVHAERALDLSITKYCSVRDSLAADLVIEWTLVLNGIPTGQRRPG